MSSRQNGTGEPKTRIRARITEFSHPPVHDGLVIGKDAPLGAEAVRKAIGLLMAAPFESISVDDDVIASVLVRAALLKRLPAESVVRFVLGRVKPLMGADEILHLDLEVEVDLEEEGA